MQCTPEGILYSLIGSINLLLVLVVPLGAQGKACGSQEQSASPFIKHILLSYFFCMQHLEQWNITTLQ